MADRPIIFSSPMILALLDGRKMQTRRLIKPQPELAAGEYVDECHYGKTGFAVWKPDGSCSCIPIKGTRFWPGDRLWVRERYHVRPGTRAHPAFSYAEEEDPAILGGFKFLRFLPREVAENPPKFGWHPSIHMPRWASRLTLTVTDVRVQRLQKISDGDAIAEGVTLDGATPGIDFCIDREWWPGGPRRQFERLWNSLHGPGAWDANPWIVALSFTVAHGNIDALAKQELNETLRAGAERFLDQMAGES